jgi:hypothetical protein
VFAVYVPENATGYLIDVEINEAAEDEGWEAAEVIGGNLSFFAPLETSGDTDGTGDSEAEAGDDGLVDLMAVFEQAGYTEADIQEFLDFNEITMEDLQAMIGAGELTLEELYTILTED